jgi:hypothetical protein
VKQISRLLSGSTAEVPFPPQMPSSTDKQRTSGYELPRHVKSDIKLLDNIKYCARISIATRRRRWGEGVKS